MGRITARYIFSASGVKQCQSLFFIENEENDQNCLLQPTEEGCHQRRPSSTFPPIKSTLYWTAKCLSSSSFGEPHRWTRWRSLDSVWILSLSEFASISAPPPQFGCCSCGQLMVGSWESGGSSHHQFMTLQIVMQQQQQQSEHYYYCRTE